MTLHCQLCGGEVDDGRCMGCGAGMGPPPDFDRDVEADLEDARMRDYDDATSLLEDNR
jgi:hypothetical protein